MGSFPQQKSSWELEAESFSNFRQAAEAGSDWGKHRATPHLFIFLSVSARVSISVCLQIGSPRKRLLFTHQPHIPQTVLPRHAQCSPIVCSVPAHVPSHILLLFLARLGCRCSLEFWDPGMAIAKCHASGKLLEFSVEASNRSFICPLSKLILVVPDCVEMRVRILRKTVGTTS